MKSVGILGVALVLTDLALFGAPFASLAVLLFWSDRIGFAYWPAVLVSAVLAAAITGLAFRRNLPRHYLPGLFASLTIVATVCSVGLYADATRNTIVAEFAPDAVLQNSFFTSLRHAPREFQFYLHAAALKDCVPYAWSYREMGFYPLPPNVAVNVLPPKWILRCGIQRQ